MKVIMVPTEEVWNYPTLFLFFKLLCKAKWVPSSFFIFQNESSQPPLHAGLPHLIDMGAFCILITLNIEGQQTVSHSNQGATTVSDAKWMLSLATVKTFETSQKENGRTILSPSVGGLRSKKNRYSFLGVTPSSHKPVVLLYPLFYQGQCYHPKETIFVFHESCGMFTETQT